MPICPKCSEEIEYLDVIVIESTHCTYDKAGNWGSKEELLDCEFQSFKCPKCEAFLETVTTTDEADTFLKGGEKQVNTRQY